MKLDEILGAFNGKNRKKAAKKTAAGLGIGVALGALAGLLFAPKSGKETREDIVEAAEKGAQVVKETAVKGAQAVKETVRDVSEIAKEKVASLKKKGEGNKEDVAEECEDEPVESAEF